MSTKHTPGPWAVLTGEFALYVTPAGGSRAIAQIPPVSQDAEANARLIAAAPELLEALQLLLDIELGGEIGGSFRERLYAAFRKSEKAVAKATGSAT